VRDLFRSFSKIRRRLRGRRILLFLDCDGTLCPIASHPSQVRLDPVTKKTLGRLSALKTRRICVISGRKLSELRAIIGLRGLIYVGNHGYEIRGLGPLPPGPVRRARKHLRFVRILALVEDKGYTLSLHYRNLRKDRDRAFSEMIKYLRAASARYPLVWRRGKKVWEIRPQGSWGKGRALVHILKRLPGSYPIALGDDKTDEDMFSALERRGLTVRVGYSRGSKASYYLRGQRQVLPFLRALCDDTG
jgi:trehalose-6-phosphatase